MTKSTTWTADIFYHPETDLDAERFFIEEIKELHMIVERGPDWNLIARIVVTLSSQNRGVRPLPLSPFTRAAG